MKQNSSIPSVPKIGALAGLGKVPAPFLIIDPGKRTGVGVYTSEGFVETSTVPLDELPGVLRDALAAPTPFKFVVCEDYHLVGGKLGAQQAGSDMPSSIGIGMCRALCEAYDVQMYLAQPNMKRGGHAYALTRAPKLLSSFQAARNDHERDTVDLAAAVVRTILVRGAA